MTDNIVNFQQEKINKEKPTIGDLINSLSSHNCDPERPEMGQQPKRSMLKITGLTRRDICDCMVLGILDCKPEVEGQNELPRVYTSEKGNTFNDFDSLVASGEGYNDSCLDATKITYNDLYAWNLDDIDPIAAVQNMACHLERRMGIYPALIDGDLKISKE